MTDEITASDFLARIAGVPLQPWQRDILARIEGGDIFMSPLRPLPRGKVYGMQVVEDPSIPRNVIKVQGRTAGFIIFDDPFADEAPQPAQD